MRTTGKFAAAILSAIMMANGLSLPMAYAAPSSSYVNVDEKYDPFAEEEMPAKEADPSKLTFKERLALQQKEEQALKRKRENELKKVEARIEELETRDKEIDETMVLPDVCTNVAECTKLSREKAAIAEELEGLYEKWEELA